MILVAVIEAVSLVAVVFLLLHEQGKEKDAWIAERRELLNRIQKPEYIPAGDAQQFDWTPDEEPDEFDLIGTIADPRTDEGG